MQPEVDTLLVQWEENYKKGLLTFWMLLLLYDRPMYALELGPAVAQASRGTISADSNSVYRALRRFERLGLVSSTWQDSAVGPQRRYYELTALGHDLLSQFIRRNILLFQESDVAARIQAVITPAEEGTN
nr:PadR family transcriptional regulator [Anaerolineae bacterium]